MAASSSSSVGFEVMGDGEVSGSAVCLRQGAVGDLADQALRERVLAPLGRARIGFQDQELSSHQLSQSRLERVGVQPRNRGERISREALPEDCRVLQQCAILRIESIQARGDRQRACRAPRGPRWGRSAGSPTPSCASSPRSSSMRIVSTAYKGAPCDRVEPLASGLERAGGHQPSQEFAHGGVGERLQVDAVIGPLPAPQIGLALGELRPAELTMKNESCATIRVGTR